MPRLTESTKTLRRDRIIEAARECFRRNGFSNTSMADIVEESGMSAGSIYSHFDGKADIMRGTAEAIFRTAIVDLTDLQRTKGSVPSPADLVRLLATTLRDNGLGPLLLQFIAESTVNPELSIVARDNLRRARELLTEVLAPWVAAHAANHPAGSTPEPYTDPARLANVMMLFLHGVLLRSAVDPEADIQQLTADVATIVPDAP